MLKKSGYIFTNKSHPEKAVMSSVLGLLSLIAIFAAIYFSFQNDGETAYQYGTVGLLSFLFSVTGMVLGVLSKFEKDKFYIFSYLGMVLNFLALAAISFILYAGAYGL